MALSRPAQALRPASSQNTKPPAKPAVASTSHTVPDSCGMLAGWPMWVSSGTAASAMPPPTT
jgi:hypothetical protein